MEFHEVWKEQKIPNKILASRSATGSIIWDFCKDSFPARKPLLITNDNVNARAPLPSRAPTPILPFERTCSGFQSRRLKQQEVLKWTSGEKAKSTGSTGQSFGTYVRILLQDDQLLLIPRFLKTGLAKKFNSFCYLSKQIFLNSLGSTLNHIERFVCMGLSEHSCAKSSETIYPEMLIFPI